MAGNKVRVRANKPLQADGFFGAAAERQCVMRTTLTNLDNH